MTKEKIFNTIQVGKEKDSLSYGYDLVMLIVVIVNVILAVVDTFEEAALFETAIFYIELVSVIYFTADYILRLWTADLLYPEVSKPKAVIKFIFSVGGLVDLLSFLPFYLPARTMRIGIVLRMFRIFRIFKLFRVNKYFQAMDVIAVVLKKKKRQLFSSILIVFVLMLAASLLMYSVEHDAQPDKFKNAFSGFWWAASTLLTVGYGDIVPVTILGRILATMITFLGVIIVAIPTGIISAGFVEQMDEDKFRSYFAGPMRIGAIEKEEETKEEKRYCPYCGKKLD